MESHHTASGKIEDWIEYEDKDILVCYKPSGIAVQTKNMRQKDMESMLRGYFVSRGEKPYVGIVHRLDQPVEGIMVYAKHQKAAAELNKQMIRQGFGKYYLAVAEGIFTQKTGTLTDYLLKDGRNNTSAVVKADTPNAKRAVLHYEVVDEQGEQSLIQVRLETGRHHQIRVQMANAGCPLAGDEKYGGTAGEGIGLCSNEITFHHPATGKAMTYRTVPQGIYFKKFAGK